MPKLPQSNPPIPIFLQDQEFIWVKDDQKTIELRAHEGRFENVQPGGQIEFKHSKSDQKILVNITRVKVHEALEVALNMEDISRIAVAKKGEKSSKKRRSAKENVADHRRMAAGFLAMQGPVPIVAIEFEKVPEDEIEHDYDDSIEETATAAE